MYEQLTHFEHPAGEGAPAPAHVDPMPVPEKDVPFDAGVRLQTCDRFRLLWEQAVAGKGFNLRLADDWGTSIKTGAALEVLDIRHWAESDHETEVIADMDGVLVWVTLHAHGGRVGAALAAPVGRIQETRTALERLKILLPEAEPGHEVPVLFWLVTSDGDIRKSTRSLPCPPWQDVSFNYPDGLRKQLGSLVYMLPGPDGRLAPAAAGPHAKPGIAPGLGGGQLILWHGPPGTGKTWALQAVASEWSRWCRVEYVTDPEAFLGSSEYLMQVLLESGGRSKGGDEKWRLLVLEDTGELLQADAKSNEGQRLSRLLNVVDGLIGRGLRVLVLVTTNEQIRALHPAVSRPGRCASAIEFVPHSPAEAGVWLHERGGPAWPAPEIRRPMSLAELYQVLGGGSTVDLPSRPRQRAIGFVP